MVATGYASATGDPRKVSKTGDTMTGALTLSGDPVGSTDAADKHYVDSQIAGVPEYPLAGYGLLAASGVPEFHTARGNLGNSTIFFTRTWIPAGVPITNLWIAISNAGIWDGLTAGNKLGLYTDAGVLVDATAETPGIFTSQGWRGGALVGGVIAAQVAGRFVYVAPLHRGMTAQPNVAFPAGANDNGNETWFSSGVGVTKRRCMIVGGQSSLPASFDPTAAGIPTLFEPLVGVS